MELPKNITQIGEVNPRCKVYVEDYVISYIRQLNQCAQEKGLAVALYGTKKEEGEITYLFLYGACKLNFLQRECRHLSQAVSQEIEKQRRKYFATYTFLGYRLLDGEMIEGFHICEQGVCRYVEGYAQFYEKNDPMLAFMLNERQGEAKPESVEQEKYDMVKKRQEQRRALAQEKTGHAFQKKPSARPGRSAAPRWQRGAAAAAVFAVMCVGGWAAMDEGRLDQWRETVGKLVEDMSQRQLSDAVEVANGTAQVGTIVAEDKLTDAIRKENEAIDATASQTPSSAEADVAGTPDGEGQSSAEETMPQPTEEPAPQPMEQPTPQPTEEPTPQPTEQPTPQPTAEPAAALASYTVRRGDTLIGICLRQYGSDARVAEICALNNISDPDDIKEGEKIFLPQ